MDYEKKHQEDLEAAKGWLAIAKENNNKIAIQILENLFPELKESEDERIRREMIEIIKNEAHEFPSSVIANKSNSWIAWLEKQGEKESADKVEPKFKVEKDKWYVCTQTYVLRGKIVVIKGQTYQAEKDNVIKGEDGCLFIDRHDGKALDYFRPWTIQDAKDGDVLYCKKRDIDNSEIIMMYSGINIRNHVDSYCRYSSELGFNAYITSVLDVEHDFIIPATKEQRDILFSKMKEAGYEWDFEAKEIRLSRRRRI